MEKAIEQINSPDRKNAQSAASLNVVLSVLEKWQPVFYQQSEIKKGMIKELLKQQYLQFTELKSSVHTLLNGHLDPEIQIAERNILISNIKAFYNRYCYTLIDIINRINENIGLSAIYDRLVETVQKFDNDPLIDLETPYFSLPVQYAEEKEKQIFAYIESGRNDSRSIMALIILYIKMKSISDAEMLYYATIAPMNFINKQDRELSETIKLMLEEIKSKNPNAYLDKTTISIDSNMNVSITERYFIDRPEDDKDIYVFLPYNADNIVLHSLVDRDNEPLHLKNKTVSWKNSCCLQFPCDKNLTEFNLKYRVKTFFEYSDNYGTYSYKYGGINSNMNYTCNITMPGALKPTAFRMLPAEIIMKDDGRKQDIVWHNPKIPFKISPLNFEGQKNGIAGEIINNWMLYNKLVYSVFVLLAFLFSYYVMSRAITNEMVYELVFVFISFAAFFFLYKDIFFVQKISTITQYLSPNILNYIRIAMTIIVCFLLVNVKFSKGNRHFRILSSVLLLSIVINVISVIIQNTDMTNQMGKFLVIISCLCYLYFFIIYLSEQLNTPKMIIGMIILAIAIASLFISNISKTIYISKEKLDILGFVFSLLFVGIIGFCYIVEHKKIRNAKVTKVEILIDISSSNLKGKTVPFVHVLLIVMIAFGLFSKLALFVDVIGILASIFGPKFLEMLNDGSLFGKTTSVKQSD
jgi:hypothetical protein